MNRAALGFLSLFVAVLANAGSSALGQIVQYELSAVDSAGSPISTIELGSTFRLQVDVTDLRSTAEGVFAGFLDIGFPSELVTPIADSILHASPYVEFTHLGSGSGSIFNAGGASNSIATLGAETRRLFSIEMRALREGTALFEPKTARELDSYDETLVYGQNSTVPESDQRFVTTSVVIVPEPSACVLLLLGLGIALARRSTSGEQFDPCALR